MTLVSDALNRLEAAGFTVIHALLPTDREVPSLELPHGVDAALRLPGREHLVVFASVATLDEDDFTYVAADALERPRLLLRPPTPLEEKLANVPATFDLRKLSADVRRAARHVGEAGLVKFALPFQGVLLSWFVVEDWYDAFLDAKEEAEAEADARFEAARKEVRAAFRAQTEAHEKALATLLVDHEFLRHARLKGTTLKRLFVLARARHPAAVEALGEARAKEVVSELAERVRVEHF